MQLHEIKNAQMLKKLEGRFDNRIINAMLKTDREIFVPESLKHSAYSLTALPMSNAQWISSPLTVAKMTSYLMSYDLGSAVSEADSVLEIGLGSGYQAVVLSHLIRRVFSIERIESLWLEARDRIARLQIMNVNIKLDDGMNGWQSYAPYDRILLSACANSISDILVSQLSNRGVLVAPIYRNGRQIIARFIKNNGILGKPEILEECEFVPILQGVERV